MNFQSFIEYDHWANELIFAEIEKLQGDEENDEILKLFAHLLAAQIVWAQRILGEKVSQPIWPEPNMNDIERMLAENPVLLKRALTSQDQIVKYQNSKGIVFKNTAEEIATHMAIHGQHHRAQIALLLRKAGISPPATDYIVYLRSQ